jgi:hypothetical protein
MPPRRASLRIIAWAVLPVLLAGPLLGVLHEASSRHRFCSEHGVVEEAGESKTGAEGEVASGRSAADSPAARGGLRSGNTEQDGAHARCALHTGTPPRATCPPRPVLVAWAPPPDLSPSPALELAPPTTPIVLLAPKTSPPSFDGLL